MDYAELKELLEKRLAVISDKELREENPEKQLQLLGEVGQAIDNWRETYREGMDRRMLHFLENYSLEKAHAFICDKLTRC